ncbi:MAG: PAS domain-containing sensor histidine kinase [Candidatus Bathyarchaeia archaeon]
MVEAGRLPEEKIQNRASADAADNSAVAQASDAYKSLFEHMNDGIAFCRVIFVDGKPVDYVVLDVNLAFKRLTRLSEKQVLNRKASEFMPEISKNYTNWIKKFSRSVLTKKSMIVEKHIPILDKWLSLSTYTPREGYFAVIIKDITWRKKIEKELRQGEKKYRKLADSINDPFFALDSSLKITYWNRSSEKHTGHASGEVVGKHFFEVFGKNRETSKISSVCLDVMRTKKPRAFTDRLPNATSCAIFELEINPTGNGVSVLAKDITERKKIQISLEEYTKRLEELVRIRTEKLKNAERMATIGETAGMIGHDIRNPLQSIIGELYLAKDELNELPESKAKKTLLTSITSIEEQTLYINKIVTDLQDYAKPLTPTIQECNLKETIQDVTLELEIPTNVKVSYYIPQAFPLMRTDASFIKRILSNLVRNGIQAMEEKGGELTVNALYRGDAVLIVVADTGIGISDELKGRIFKPLFTTKSKGQGFGLAVVKKLTEALGGTVSFETKLGKGTTFIIELPLRPNDLA